jgi:predicted dehydrogenase
MRKLRLGIIGTGIAARELHLPALRVLADRFEIVQVASRTPANARRFARMVGGVPWTDDYRELLRNPAVEAVDIVAPISLNLPATRDALAAGKHVFVEKPLAGNLPDARRMCALARTARTVCYLAENYRHHPVYLRVRDLLRAGAIGRPYAWDWHAWYHMRNNDKYAKTQWRRHNQHIGGLVTDAGVHYIAALRMWFGELEPTTTWARSINPGIGDTDTFSMTARASHDVHGTFSIFFTARGCSDNTLTVFGTKGTLSVVWNRLTIYIPGKQPHTTTVPDDGGFRGEFAEFHRAVTTGGKFINTFAEGYRDLETMLTALALAGKTNRTQSGT